MMPGSCMYYCACSVETNMFPPYDILSFKPCAKHAPLVEPEMTALREKWSKAMGVVLQDHYAHYGPNTKQDETI